jgi:class 3 adenylate cyclase
MMRGLLDIKRSTLLVYVQTVNNRGKLVPVQPNYRAILAPENLGIDQQLRDPDSVPRIFSERLLSRTDVPVPTLAGQLLRGLGKPVDEGFIDYSVGAPVEWIPLHRLIAWSDDVPRLQKLFGGRIVLIGSLSKTTDRWRLPATLLAADPSAAQGTLAYNQPGVLVHLQVLRSHLAHGLLHPLPEPARWALVALALLAVFLRFPPVAMILCAVVVPLIVVAAGVAAIAAVQLVLPVASLITAFWLALLARGVFDAVAAVADRLRLQQSFAGQVSPAVMREMLGGGLRPGVSGQPADVCVLFSDVRDFTTLSENMPADVVITVLQRYFDRMVRPVHRFNGTVDKFIGDGMMVLFGAPRKSADPCVEAVQCALAMMAELDQLNAEFAREGLPTLVIGIGINYGSATVGNIGSSERHNYSAIGDAVNVAARVEGLTKDLGRKIIITEAVVSRIEKQRFHFDPLGSHNVKGHSPVQVWGIRTSRIAPPVKEAEAIQ